MWWSLPPRYMFGGDVSSDLNARACARRCLPACSPARLPACPPARLPASERVGVLRGVAATCPILKCAWCKPA